MTVGVLQTATFRVHSALVLSVYHSLQVIQCPPSVSRGDVKVTANAGGVLVFVSFCCPRLCCYRKLRCFSRTRFEPDLLQCGLLFSVSISVCSDSTASAKMTIINGGEAVFWQTVKQKMGLTITQTSTDSHSATTHAHTSSHTALCPHKTPLCGVVAVVWILKPASLDKKDTADYVSNEKLPHPKCKSGNVSPDELLVSFQLHQLHYLSSWLATNTGCSHKPRDELGYICWADAMRHG